MDDANASKNDITNIQMCMVIGGEDADKIDLLQDAELVVEEIVDISLDPNNPIFYGDPIDVYDMIPSSYEYLDVWGIVYECGSDPLSA